MNTPTIEDLVAAFQNGQSIRYQTNTGFSELIRRKVGYPEGAPRYGFRHSSHQNESKPVAFLTTSPEQSIRRALTEPRTDGSFRVLEIWGKVSEMSAPPVPEVVPLGENVTRDGRRARVICNDAEGDHEVVALVQVTKGSRIQTPYFYTAKGAHPVTPELDLVGLKHHEIQPLTEVSELEDLRRWKAEATKLLDTTPLQEIGEEMGLTVGDDVGPKILPYIRRLKAVISGIGNLVNAARLNQ